MKAGYQPGTDLPLTGLSSKINGTYGLDTEQPTAVTNPSLIDQAVAAAVDEAWPDVKRPGILGCSALSLRNRDLNLLNPRERPGSQPLFVVTPSMSMSLRALPSCRRTLGLQEARQRGLPSRCGSNMSTDQSLGFPPTAYLCCHALTNLATLVAVTIRA